MDRLTPEQPIVYVPESEQKIFEQMDREQPMVWKNITKEEWEEFIKNWERPEPQITTGRMGKELFHKLMQEELERCKDSNYFYKKYCKVSKKDAKEKEVRSFTENKLL